MQQRTATMATRLMAQGTGLGLALWLAGGGTAMAATLPLRWHWSNPLPHGNNVKDMAYSSALGLAVQVCEKGRIYTSYDLSWWTARDSGTTNALRAAVFLNGRIVVVGENGTVLYADSPDHFQVGTLPATSNWLEGVAAAPLLGVAVAVGDNGSIYRSTDGITWTKRTVPFTNNLYGVAYGGGRFVTVGDNGFIAGSSDGQTWNTNRSGTSATLYKVTAIGSSFMAVGAGGVVLTNSATLWAPVGGLTATNDLYAVAGEQSAPRLVAGDLELWLNMGTSWGTQLKPTYAAGAPAWTYLSALSFGGTANAFLAGGRTGMLVEAYRTNSTYSWVESEYSVRNWLWDAWRIAGLYIAVGDNSTIMTSADGVNWSLELPPASLTNRVFLGVGGNTNLLVAAGDGGTLLTSTNSWTAVITTNASSTNVTYTTNWVSNLGLVWNAAASGTTNSLQGVAERNGRYLVAGDAGTILTCDDGLNWITRASPANANLSGAAAGAQGFAVSGAFGALWFSADGASWDVIATGTTNWIYRVRCLDGQWIAVGQNGLLLTSTNGANWQARSSGTSVWLNDVTRVGDDYFAVGALGTVLYSTNAIDWQAIVTPTGKALYAAASDGRQLIAAGVEGVILRSQIQPLTNAVHITGFAALKGTNTVQNLFLFSGRADQQFNLESNDDLNPTNWFTDATLEIQATDGTLYYLQTINASNAPTTRFFRTRLAP